MFYSKSQNAKKSYYAINYKVVYTFICITGLPCV